MKVFLNLNLILIYREGFTFESGADGPDNWKSEHSQHCDIFKIGHVVIGQKGTDQSRKTLKETSCN